MRNPIVLLLSALRPRRYSIPAGIIMALLILPAAISRADDEDLRRLAEQVMERRSRIEILSDELEHLNQKNNEDLGLIAAQKAGLTENIARERARLNQLEKDLAIYRTSLDFDREFQDALRPILFDILSQTRSYMTSTIPFQLEERIAEIDRLERVVSSGEMDPLSALSRLWQLLDTELRLGEGIGLYRQTIELSGQAKLAEVIHLGMIFLYFRTLDGTYGYAAFTADGWIFQEAESSQDSRNIAALFDSVKKNVRQGYFELPNPLGK